MIDDTDIGGPHGAFPVTRDSMVLAIGSTDGEARRRAIEQVVAVYWKPVYRTIRIRWGCSNEDAKDLTQSFFARVAEKSTFSAYDPSKGTFRTFVRTCLDRFVANERKAAARLKRGGGERRVSIEAGETGLESALVTPSLEPESLFHREWVRGLFETSLNRFEAECRRSGNEIRYRIFEAYDIDDPPGGRPRYDDLASRFDIPITSITNHLAWARRRFRETTLALLRELTASDAEYRAEARALLGVELP